ncbi:S8 family serine peptidase [Mycoplasmatota bacterium]|nr:S8 family serine peptidase [Mycoplasmatota bacterium]
MKKIITKRFIISFMLLLLLIGIAACSLNETVVDSNESHAITNEEEEAKIEEINENIDYEVEDDQHFDSEGNLLVPYDIAYKEAFESGEVLFDDRTMLIKFSNDFDGEISRNLKTSGIDDLRLTTSMVDGQWYEATIKSDLDIKNVMSTVRTLNEVLIADYNYIYETEEIVDYPELSDNPFLDDQWYLENYGIPEAWTWLDENGYQAGGSSSVVVAVIDTGVDYNHIDLAQNMWVNNGEIPGNGIDDDENGYIDDVHGVNVVSDDRFHTGDPMDDHGHGTHVAGLIAAADNKEGIVGVAYNSKIMAIKAGQASGYFTQADIAEAILYAYDNGADVINMSFGGTGMSIAVQDALRTAYTRSVLVASAGNNGAPNQGFFAIPNYPAAYSYVLGVMSVDVSGRESVFTNYDSFLYNKVEYEVYAPGEAMMSTLPNDNYAKWSGTSMAAPIVSGMAALIRSAYSDRDMYPNKFIMGQLAATSETQATCLNPNIHGVHNVPMIADAFLALSKMPKPDVSLFDYYIFDDEDIASENNGDGIIDAGETIDIGLILKNRWGMSENTVVSIDAISAGGVENPYVSFLTNDIDFGGVGTYSTKDMLLRDDQFVVGAENPFRVKIDENTPNDYIIRINLHATMNNALDENDTNTYHFPPNTSIELTVRNGLILPNVIEEDMTLTSDNYYIIPNATIIKEGATVTVEPGTKIQFWTDDPESPYADTAITYLKVEGQFITQGTTDNPVELFPSDLMSRYRVEIYESNKGYVSLNNTEITNSYLNITETNRVVFKQNYLGPLYFRYLSSGNVDESYSGSEVFVDYFQNSIFYGLGTSERHYYYEVRIRGNVINSIFVNSNVEIESGYLFKENVFLKNNSNDYNVNLSSNISLSYLSKINTQNVFYNEDTGKTYIVLKNTRSSHLESIQRFAEQFNGHLLMIETEEEYNYLRNNIFIDYYNPDSYFTGLIMNSDGSYNWLDGSVVGDYINLNKSDSEYYNYQGFVSFMDNFSNTTFGGDNAIIEIPNAIYISGITLNELSTEIDMESNYQINASVNPSTANKDDLIYLSDDEGVATVSDTGLIQPVSYGSAKIYIYSNDYNKQAAFEVNVVEKIQLESIDANLSNYQLEVGSTSNINVEYYPMNSTQKEVRYESLDETIATVNQYGDIEARGVGSTIIKIYSSVDETIYDEFEVSVVNPATSISFEESTYVTDLSSTDDNIMPKILPVDATNKNIVWESSNPEVAYVENNQLVKVSEGVTTLRATIENTNLRAELILSVNENYSPGKVIKMQKREGYYFALYSDGNLYYWGQDVLSPKLIQINTSIIDFAFYKSDLYVITHNNELHCYEIPYNSGYIYSEAYFNFSYNIADLVEIESDPSHDSLYILKSDGSVWAKGYNGYGQLGDGSTTERSNFVQVLVNDIVDIETGYHLTTFLSSTGNLYISGGHNTKYSTPKIVKTDVINIASTYSNSYVSANDNINSYYYDSGQMDYNEPYQSINKINDSQLHFYHQNSIYITNGLVFVKGSNSSGYFGIGEDSNIEGYYSDFQQMLKVENAEDIFIFSGNIFVQTSDNKFYGSGRNTSHELANFTTDTGYVPNQIFFGLVGNDGGFIVENINISEQILYDDEIVIDFNEALLASEAYSNITVKDSANQTLAINKNVDLDEFKLSLYSDWIIGETYTLTIPANALTTKFMVENEALTYSFTYMGEQTPIDFISSSITDGHQFTKQEIDIALDYTYAREGNLFTNIEVQDDLGNVVSGINFELIENSLLINGVLDYDDYKLVIPAGALIDNMDGMNTLLEINFSVEQTLEVVDNTHQDGSIRKFTDEDIVISFNQANESTNFNGITLYDALDQVVPTTVTLTDNILTINPDNILNENTHYYLVIPEDAVIDNLGNINEVMTFNFSTYTPIELMRSSINDLETNVNPNQTIRFFYNYAEKGTEFANISVYDSDNEIVEAIVELIDNVLYVTPLGQENKTYTIDIPSAALKDELGVINQSTQLTYSTIIEEERFFYTTEYIDNQLDLYVEDGLYTQFYNNAILNNFNDTDVENWLRFVAREGSYSESNYESIGLGHNYWGTTNIEMINKQILDFDDYQSLYDINEGLILQTAPDTAFPFVTDVTIINSSGEEVTVVGNEAIQVIVEFNRDMDMTTPLDVRFGSSQPYAEYKIEGSYESPRKWVGIYTLTTTIENGNQYFSIDNGHVEGDSWFALQPDLARFMFEIDTTSAQAMIMQGVAEEAGITLTWDQDDFDTLAGYNVYRSTSEDGFYRRLNDHVLPADVKTFFDDTVEPGVVYYYNFTVVKTDLTESLPSGKIVIQSLDTMAPNIYHTPIYQAYTNSNLVVTASITDNLMITEATLYYRFVGETNWRSVKMTNNNDRYSAVISAEYLTLDGLEYYIQATDGVTDTYKGTDTEPYSIVVKQAIDANAFGDVNGDDTITVLDALMVLQAINDRLNLSSEEFLRADLDEDGVLEAWEALRILQYVSGKVTTIK